MAHADYNCCLICDRKMDYNGGEGDTKENACSECLIKMRDMATLTFTQKEVIDFLRGKDDKDAITWLQEVGYNPCYYSNPIDDYLIEREIERTDAEDGKWGKKLKTEEDLLTNNIKE